MKNKHKALQLQWLHSTLNVLHRGTPTFQGLWY
jgi:hypothetical protein